MEFQTTSALKRPVRLPAWLRRWAWESMHGKYGTEAMQTPYIEIEDERFEALSDIDKYDRMIKEIAARVGYDNPLNFSTEFKKFFGSSPRNFHR